jgi:hypothetical protein
MINWTISQLDRQTSDGFVTTAHWTAVATDGDYSASVINTCSWEGEPTVAYDSLTQDDVLGWVWQSVDKEAVEAALEAQIELQKNPVTASGVPWEGQPAGPNSGYMENENGKDQLDNQFG